MHRHPEITRLETAAQPAGLKRIAIDPLTRVEGHGKVTLLQDADNHIQQARLHIVEFRGFEKFIQGRPYWELPVLVQRLCGICPVSHHLAAAKATDQLVGVDELTPTADKVRRLMHLGQTLQSHALHFFHLSSPDLLFGFDDAVGHRNIIGVIQDYPEIAKQGVLLRKYGQEVIRVTSGKRIHGSGAIPGGVNKALTTEERDYLRADSDQMIAWAESAVQLMKRVFLGNPDYHYRFGAVDANTLSLIGSGWGLRALPWRPACPRPGWPRNLRPPGLPGLRTAPKRGDQILELHEVSLHRRPRAGKRAGTGSAPWRGSTTATASTPPWRNRSARTFARRGRGGPCRRPSPPTGRGSSSCSIAPRPSGNCCGTRTCWAPTCCGCGERRLQGIGVVEAPRGTLFHHYEMDADGLVTKANLIVSTTNNNQVMNAAIRQVAAHYLDGQELTEPLLNHIEVAIRAYDPCLSCATHAVGKMPLELELVDASGQVVDRLYQRASGQIERGGAGD